MNRPERGKFLLRVFAVASFVIVCGVVAHLRTRTEVPLRIGGHKVYAPIPEPGHVTIVGQITEAGSPLEGVKVYGGNLDEYSVSDSRGIYIRGDGPAKRVKLIAQFVKNSGFPLGRWYELSRAVEPGEITRIDIDFGDGSATLEGRVTRNGEPVAGQFNITNVDLEGADREYLFSHHIETDSEGRFIQQHLPSGEYVLSMFKQKESQGVSFGVDIPVSIATGRLHWVDYELQRGATVSGRIEGLKSDAELKDPKQEANPRRRHELDVYARSISTIRLVRGDCPDMESSLQPTTGEFVRIVDGRFSISNVRPGTISFIIGNRCVHTVAIPEGGLEEVVISIPEGTTFVDRY